MTMIQMWIKCRKAILVSRKEKRTVISTIKRLNKEAKVSHQWIWYWLTTTIITISSKIQLQAISLLRWLYLMINIKNIKSEL